MVRTFTHDGAGTPASAWSGRREWSDVARVDLDEFDRVVVVSAHPDDETLGAGGLLASAEAAGLDVHLVVCTAGEHSHPRSPTHAPGALAVRRRVEVRAALRELAPCAALTLLDLVDGRVHERQTDLTGLLVRELGDARRTLLVAPWRHDGHTDHDAVGRAAATASVRTGATLWEYPVWWWHWARPDEAPWTDLRRLDLAPGAVECRARALAHHRSQTEPLSDAPGDEALLSADFVSHFTGPADRFVVQPVDDDALDRLHRDEPDPWGVDVRWYERRKRALCLALLPRERFARGVEVGCSVGALTAQLAARCDALVAIDSSPAAVTEARRRLDGLGHVEVREGDALAAWPDGELDLVVVSEVGYFLSPRALDELVERVRGSLAADGVVLLCHWRHPISGWPLNAARVHAAFERGGLPAVRSRCTERDVEVVVLAADAAWPAADA